MPAIPVSVIVMTKNEADNIGPCLDALKDFDEVFVVDSGSDDSTPDIARDHGAYVCGFDWNGKYPKKKQWCLENLPFRHRHVLYVDADERMRPELAAEIRAAITLDQFAGWFVGLDYVWLGRILRHGTTMYKLALFDRERGRFVEWNDLDATRMWEVEGHYQPVIDGPTTTLSARLLHDDHDRLYDWFERHNRYSDWEAVVRVNGAVADGGETQAHWRRYAKRVFVRLPGKPIIVLVHALLVRAGWRDGRPGVHFAIAKAMYQWQIDLKSEEIRRRGLTTSTAAEC
jgi:glycosyltransferase involved in cell wall biosynthesis